MTVLINSVLEIDGASYRIIRRRGSEFILFPLHQDALTLKGYPADELDEALKNGTVKYAPDPYEKLRLSSPPPKIMARARSRFDSIKELISDPRLYDPLTRRAAFRDASGGDKKLLIKLRRNLSAYWKKGLTVTALIPESGRATGCQTSGRKGQCPRSPEMNAHLEMICRKYLLSQNHLSLEKAYMHSLEEWEKKYPDTPAPSRTQLRYYFERHYRKPGNTIKPNPVIISSLNADNQKRSAGQVPITRKPVMNADLKQSPAGSAESAGQSVSTPDAAPDLAPNLATEDEIISFCLGIAAGFDYDLSNMKLLDMLNVIIREQKAADTSAIWSKAISEISRRFKEMLAASAAENDEA
ncbi:hypothetical protein [Succinimonas sp.]|uniref:hypothetical protein n=1 Tax=Succinimonas sp. TaxID=1936151 RepID=UPI00386BAEE6